MIPRNPSLKQNTATAWRKGERDPALCEITYKKKAVM